MNKIYHFLSGLPRSGSTLLSAILNQNPEVYCTPTSPLLDQLIVNQNIWHSLQTVKTNPIPIQLDNITRELINNMWGFRSESIIIDKNRGWGKNMPAAEFLFQKKVKMIATVRDIPSIMASWLTLLKKNPNNYMNHILISKGLKVNDENMMDEMWNNMVKDCVDGINQAIKDAPDQIYLVDYDNLVNNPIETISGIESFLCLPKHQYDFDNIKSDTNDDDMAAWGLVGMHKIRTSINKTAKTPEEILGNKLFQKYNFNWKNT